MFLTKDNRLLSVIGSLWIGFAPAVQWWFDTPASVVELILFAQGMIVSVIYFVKFKNFKYSRLFYLLTFTLASVGFTTVVYPPIQVSLDI